MTRHGLVVVMLLWCAVSHAGVRRFALVVGSNTGEGVQAAPLRYADDDAVSMHELFKEAGIESALVATLDNDTARLHPLTAGLGEATLTRLKQVFAAQVEQMSKARAQGAEVEWIFFFSGHGDVERGEGFLGLGQGQLTRSQLHDEILAKAPADRVHVIIDACKSAFIVAGKGPGGKRLPFPYAFASDPARPTHIGFVLSASSLRDSHEWERYQAGVFSHEVRSGLRGGADVNGDGSISYGELGAFLHSANQAIASPAYRPDFMVLPPQGAAGLSASVLTWPKAPTVLADADLGHVYVERPSGERLLDLHPARGFFAKLFLPAERPLFIRSADDRREVKVEPEGAVKLSELAVTSASTASKGSLNMALQQLFASPFGADTVERWSSNWRAPELTSLELSLEPRTPERLRRTVGWTALGTAAAGATFFAVAWGRTAESTQFSQAYRVQRNRELSALNTAGVASMAVAGVAGAAWLGLTLWNDPSAPKVSLALDATGGTLVLSGAAP